MERADLLPNGPDLAAAPVSLEVQDLVKRYSDEVVVGPISFSVREGEFFSLLGPSGCGKSTTLRAIAGFESPDGGAILLGGRRIERVPPHKRDVGLVFQSHALFPHLTVAENISFGLDLRKTEKSETARRVEAALELVGLTGYGQRMPGQISGGQQQRVALARSLILEPSLLLLDEPLSSLDLKLRVQMREELRRLQRRLQKTSIFVTHDQTEALALSDRIAVLSQGRIEQIGTPDEIYNTPASCFVADFIGSSNLLPAEVIEQRGDEVDLMTPGGMRLTARARNLPKARNVTALIRPERVTISVAQTNGHLDGNHFSASITDIVFLGEDTHVRVAGDRIDPLLVTLKSSGDSAQLPSARLVHVHIDPSSISILER